MNGPIAYIVKRFPRLSETFVLNEVRAVERLGTRLHIYSLLPREPGLVQPSVGDLKSCVSYYPSSPTARALTCATAHVAVAVSAPARYLRALGAAFAWSLTSRRPFAVWKHFYRSGLIARDCRRRGVARLHAHFAHSPATVAHFAHLMTGIPFSFTAHAKDLYLSPERSIRRKAEASDFIATCTAYNVRHLRRIVGLQDASKIHLVYHGIDIEPFKALARQRHDHDLSPGIPKLLSVGRFVEKKGMFDLLEALRILARRGVAFECDVVGGGPLHHLLDEAVRAHGLTKVVRLRGPMAHDELLGYYASATLFVLAPFVTDDGDRDGIPNVLVEAMAAGVPVVSTKVSGIPELVDDGRTGVLVDPRDSSALADAMARLLNAPGRRMELAKAARRSVDLNFECWRNAGAMRALLHGGTACTSPEATV